MEEPFGVGVTVAFPAGLAVCVGFTVAVVFTDTVGVGVGVPLPTVPGRPVGVAVAPVLATGVCGTAVPVVAPGVCEGPFAGVAVVAVDDVSTPGVLGVTLGVAKVGVSVATEPPPEEVDVPSTVGVSVVPGEVAVSATGLTVNAVCVSVAVSEIGALTPGTGSI